METSNNIKATENDPMKPGIGNPISPETPPNQPEKSIPAKEDPNPDPTKHMPGGNEPEKVDPTRIEEPHHNDPTRIKENSF